MMTEQEIFDKVAEVHDTTLPYNWPHKLKELAFYKGLNSSAVG